MSVSVNSKVTRCNLLLCANLIKTQTSSVPRVRVKSSKDLLSLVPAQAFVSASLEPTPALTFLAMIRQPISKVMACCIIPLLRARRRTGRARFSPVPLLTASIERICSVAMPAVEAFMVIKRELRLGRRSSTSLVLSSARLPLASSLTRLLRIAK